MNTKSKSRTNTKSATASAPSVPPAKPKAKKPRSPWTNYFVLLTESLVWDYRDKVRVDSEIELYQDPMLIDVVVVKLEDGVVIDNAVMRRFERYNIIEFKGPGDTLNIAAWDKTMSYFYAYLSNEKRKKVAPINFDDVTLTIVSVRRPRELLKILREERKYKIVDTETPGIYYISRGDNCVSEKVQLVVTSELPRNENDKSLYWLGVFHENLTPKEGTDAVIRSEETEETDPIRKVVPFILDVNPNIIEEMEKMAPSKAREFFRNYAQTSPIGQQVAQEWVYLGRQEGRQEGMQSGIRNLLAFLKSGHSLEEAERQFALS